MSCQTKRKPIVIYIINFQLKINHFIDWNDVLDCEVKITHLHSLIHKMKRIISMFENCFLVWCIGKLLIQIFLHQLVPEKRNILPQLFDAMQHLYNYLVISLNKIFVVLHTNFVRVRKKGKCEIICFCFSHCDGYHDDTMMHKEISFNET